MHGSSPLTEANLCMKFESSFSWKDWVRLRDTWNAVVTSQSQIHRHAEQLDKIVSEESSYRNYASDIQNRQIMIQIVERNVNKARELVRTARYQLNAFNSALSQMSAMFKSQEENDSQTEHRILELNNQNAEMRLELSRLRNELVFRRRHMLKSLYELFFPPKLKHSSSAALLVFKRQCFCSNFDAIRSLHFPSVPARLGHNDAELSSAAGFIVQLLLAISHILDIPLKHLLLFNGSRSAIFSRSSLERFDLFSTSSAKSQRNRLDQAMYMLSEVIVQLRAESGVVSKETDRPIRLVQELLLSFIGSHRFVSVVLHNRTDK
ncbi:hypothetical protein niasHS_013550 [Heterodera schachtii]|uniref:Uncharacterized protein n=1 Tax=Heterodera schachtii TaxID=97005 RepID=A0ABD2I771_HETSC